MKMRTKELIENEIAEVQQRVTELPADDILRRGSEMLLEELTYEYVLAPTEEEAALLPEMIQMADRLFYPQNNQHVTNLFWQKDDSFIGTNTYIMVGNTWKEAYTWLKSQTELDV